MTKTKFALISGLITFFAAGAHADAINVACYANNSEMYVSFDQAPVSLTFQYQAGSQTDSFITSPTSAFAKANSYVTELGTPATATLKMVAQMVAGDPETPLFVSSAEVDLAKNSDGQFILQKADVYHNSNKIDLSVFVGHPCYVQ